MFISYCSFPLFSVMQKGEEILVKVPYKIDITEAERSTINNVSNASTNKEGRSSGTWNTILP